MSDRRGTNQRLGHVDVKGGALVLVDFGLAAAFAAPGAARAAADAALAAGKSAFELGGVSAVVVRDVPPGRYPVVCELVPSGEFEGMRRSIAIELVPKKKAARRVALGAVPVDMARIGLFDVDALERWNEEAPADGKADIVFWGLHEEEVARRFQAPKVENDVYGFVDRPIAEASAIGLELHAPAPGTLEVRAAPASAGHYAARNHGRRPPIPVFSRCLGVSRHVTSVRFRHGTHS